MDRRFFLAGATALAAASAVRAAPAPALGESLRRLERRSGGRLGVALLEGGTGRRFAWRGDEAFPMCSTFKVLLAAALLAKAAEGRERLDRRIAVTAADLLPNSPFADSRVGHGATLLELARAIIVDSDNAAANLLLPVIGGPPGLNRYARTLGDKVTRLDRSELELGQAVPGDPRDTTAPAPMAANLEHLLVGSALRAADRRLLLDWMIACRTGKARLRAGLPAGWRVGNKTGSGANGTCNDIAILWPKGGKRPLLVAAYLTASPLESALRESILAAVGHAVATSGAAALSPAGAGRLRS